MASDFDHLALAAIALGTQPFIMPIDEIRMAHAFSSLPDTGQVVHRLVRELFDHENMHVRRIAVNATRHCKLFQAEGLQEALTRKLEDAEAWVRYDAAWAIQEAGYDSEDIRRLLAVEAARCSPTDDAMLSSNRGDSSLQARVKARVVLEKLAAKTPD